jgi:hypothetical protein
MKWIVGQSELPDSWGEPSAIVELLSQKAYLPDA